MSNTNRTALSNLRRMPAEESERAVAQYIGARAADPMFVCAAERGIGIGPGGVCDRCLRRPGAPCGRIGP